MSKLKLANKTFLFGQFAIILIMALFGLSVGLGILYLVSL